MLTLVYQQHDLSVYSESSVIKAEDCSRIVEANELVALARQEAEQINMMARLQADQLKLQSRMQGRSEGLASVSEQLASLALLKQKQIHGDASVIVESVLFCLDQLLTESSALFYGRIKALIEQSNCGQWVRVRVAPEQLQVCEQAFRRDLHQTAQIEWLSDDTLQPGDAVLETTQGSVSAPLSSVLKGVRAALEEAFGVESAERLDRIQSEKEATGLQHQDGMAL